MRDKDHLLSQLRIEREPVVSSSRKRIIQFSIVPAGVLLLIIGGTAVWLMSRPVPVSVEMARVTVAENPAHASVLNASGYVTARRQATVSSKLTGKVVEVLVEEGMHVDQNQILARLDDSNIRSEMRLIESQLVAARTRVGEAQARLREVELNAHRTHELFSRGLISQAERDAAEAAYQSLRAQLQTRLAEVKTAEENVALMQQQLNDLIIRAPFGGVVVAKNAQPGEMISPISAGGGFTRTGICSLVDMSSLEIEVDVSEAYIQRVYAAQPVEAVLDAYPEWRIPARVIAVVPTADRQKATVKVRIGFEHLDARILPDMGVKVAFLAEKPAENQSAQAVQIHVPASALQQENDQHILYVVRENKAERRSVNAVKEGGDNYKIVSGLKPGENYVRTIPEKLRDGVTVTIQ